MPSGVTDEFSFFFFLFFKRHWWSQYETRNIYCLKIIWWVFVHPGPKKVQNNALHWQPKWHVFWFKVQALIKVKVTLMGTVNIYWRTWSGAVFDKPEQLPLSYMNVCRSALFIHIPDSCQSVKTPKPPSCTWIRG